MTSLVIKIAVQDANVLIDLEIAGLFDLWFQTGIETHTTDLIRAELEKGGHAQAVAYFTSGQVVEHALSFEEIMAVSELEREVGSKAKFNDCSVLYLAMKLDAHLGRQTTQKGGQGATRRGSRDSMDIRSTGEAAVDHGQGGSFQAGALAESGAFLTGS